MSLLKDQVAAFWWVGAFPRGFVRVGKEAKERFRLGKKNSLGMADKVAGSRILNDFVVRYYGKS
jgi:hypothetical protein